MNLFLRLFWVLITSYFKPRLTHVLTPSRLTLRVLPNDLDTNLHMNNGRYFTIMDLGRFDMILRTGLRALMIRKKSVPVIAATTVRFRQDLDFWQKYHLDTRLVCWDAKWVYIEQRFIYAGGPKRDRVAAIALLKGGFYDPLHDETLPTQDLLDALNMTDQSPPFPPEITTWQVAEEALRQVTKTIKN
jgi:acyl-CoA thioesterase FadM